MRLLFKFNYIKEENQTLVSIQYLRGRALHWVAPFVMDYLNSGNDEQKIFSHFDTFIEHMAARFDEPNRWITVSYGVPRASSQGVMFNVSHNSGFRGHSRHRVLEYRTLSLHGMVCLDDLCTFHRLEKEMPEFHYMLSYEMCTHEECIIHHEGKPREDECLPRYRS